MGAATGTAPATGAGAAAMPNERPGVNVGTAMPASRLPLERTAAAVLETLAYSDVFDWPLSLEEIHTFLPAPAASAEVAVALDSLQRDGRVDATGPWWALGGRESLAERRWQWGAAARQLWPVARRAAVRVAALPWVRLVAVSGSLAVGAAEPDADIDLFVVTEDGRLWLARALTIALARATTRSATAGTPLLCPNYLLSTSALSLPERDLFTARELAQLVPIAGWSTYRALLDANAWYRDFLPNHRGAQAAQPEPRRAPVQRVAETLLGHRRVDRLERWEMSRKIARLTAGDPGREVRFGPTLCKGHFGGHGQRVMEAYEQRLARLQLVAP